MTGEPTDSKQIEWRSPRVWRAYLFAMIVCIILLIFCTLPVMVICSAVGIDGIFIVVLPIVISTTQVVLAVYLIAHRLKIGEELFNFIKLPRGGFLLISVWILLVNASVSLLLRESGRLMFIDVAHRQPFVWVVVFGAIYGGSLLSSYLQKISRLRPRVPIA